MQASDLLKQMGGLGAVARELGVDERQAQRGAEALLPAILGGLKQQAQAQPAGPAGLLEMLGKLGGGKLMDEVLAAQPTNLEHGNQLLGQIFGSKDVSRAVVQNVSGQTGLNPETLKKMLPMLGMLVAGYLSKQGGAPAQAAPGPGGGLGDMLGKALGGQGGAQAPGGAQMIAALLDTGGGGNPLNELLKMAGKLRGNP